MGDAVEDHYYFAGAMVDHGLQRFVELLAGFTNGEAATDVENGDGPAGANVYFHGGVIGHRDDSPSGGYAAVRGSFPLGCIIRRRKKTSD